MCLPRNRSMVEGHCLIVTLQHVVQSTACDEDVLEEINVSRGPMFYVKPLKIS